MTEGHLYLVEATVTVFYLVVYGGGGATVTVDFCFAMLLDFL